jgi:DNA ligase (NAD+)
MSKQVTSLAAKLTQARDAYYNGKPIMSDLEFDVMEDKLRKLDPGHAFFSKVGAAPVSGWSKVTHKIPMTSLNKAQDADDMRTWGNGRTGYIAAGEFIWIEKLDGISISLRYDKGILTQAVTRGDGSVGEDITRNVKLMKGLPSQLAVDPSWSGYVRGEIVCLRSDFDAHFPGESNPRNTASGTAKRQSDPRPCAHLTVMPFQCLPDTGMYATKKGELTALQSLGFTHTPQWWTRDSLTAIFDTYNEYVATRRDNLDYEIDGLVVSLNDNQKWEDAGEKNHRPAGSIAFKFPHESATTRLQDIIWQVGNSGRVTPVAEFDSVPLAGANVRRASLHNISNIGRIASEAGHTALRKGDLIMVSRRNDVIPYVEALVTPKTSGALLSVPPTDCPCCGTALQMDGEYLVCNGTMCSAQVSGSIKRWVKKVGILDWGTSVIDVLVDSELIKDPADLYKLDETTLSAVQLSGRRVGSGAKTMLANLHAKTDLPVNVVVGSLGIDLMGRSMVKKLVDAGYDTLDALATATVQEFASVPGMGQTKAEAFHSGFHFRSGLISKLVMNGITIKAPSTGFLKGMTVCMTGFRDAAMHDAIEAAGGTIKSSVVRDLDYLVAKDPSSTSGKAKKARDQLTHIVSIEDMQSLLS